MYLNIYSVSITAPVTIHLAILHYDIMGVLGDLPRRRHTRWEAAFCVRGAFSLWKDKLAFLIFIET